MTLFCLLCIPLLYTFRRIGSPERKGGFWALALGCVAAALHYFFSPLVNPNGFGVSRWIGGFIDIVGLPALVPLVICLLLTALRALPASIDYAGFTLLWLIPPAAVRSISFNSPPSLLPLVIVPLLWMAQAAGIPFLANCIRRNPRWYVTIPLSLGIAALPIAAATSWWAFFCQRSLPGLLLLLVSLIPISISVVMDVVTEK